MLLRGQSGSGRAVPRLAERGHVPYARRMGLGSETIQIIARLLKDRQVGGTAITFGVQKIGGDRRQVG